MTGFFLAVAGMFAAYGFGFWDGLKARPPEPLRGNYPHCEELEGLEGYDD